MMRTLPVIQQSSVFWSELLSDNTGQLDSEAIAILSLALAARTCARVVRGSNPIWYRTSLQETNRSDQLRDSALTISTRITDDLKRSMPKTRKETKLINSDFATDIVDGTFDVCLTSPPYLNQLDYVVAHLPELTVLGRVMPIDINNLRSLMIGTTKIVSKDNSPIPEEWGIICRRTLNAIRQHDSYASKRYYYFTYRQYFEKLYNSLRNLSFVLRRRAQGLMVMQNSYYKNVNIPTPHVAAEMLAKLHWKTTIVRTQTVKAHMGRLSPKQSEYAPMKTLGKSLVHFYR